MVLGRGRRHDEATFFEGCFVCFVSCKRQDRVKKGRRESFYFLRQKEATSRVVIRPLGWWHEAH